jgi:hypothetical protein
MNKDNIDKIIDTNSIDNSIDNSVDNINLINNLNSINNNLNNTTNNSHNTNSINNDINSINSINNINNLENLENLQIINITNNTNNTNNTSNLNEEEKLISKIKKIDLLYKKYIYELRLLRLKSLLKSNENIINKNEFISIKDIEFIIDEKNHEWNISYTYEQKNEQNMVNLVKIKLTYYDNKYKIIGNNSRFKIYINSKKIIRIIFKDLDDEYILEKHLDLIKKLLNDNSIPEYLALQILSSISYNNWDGNDIFNYFYV